MIRVFFILLLISSVAVSETIDEKRQRCSRDCASLSPDMEKMKQCYLDEVNCIIPEKDPAFNELNKDD